MRKLFTGGLVLAVVAFCVAYFGSPILAAHQLTRAAETGDRAELERLVDFPSLRSSLKGELREELVDRMRDRAPGGGTLANLGMMLAPGIVSGAVDVLVTPEAVAAMVETGRAPNPVRQPDRGAGRAERPKLHRAYGYRDLDTFALTLTREDRPEESLALLFSRRALFSWKLAAVDLQAGA